MSEQIIANGKLISYLEMDDEREKNASLVFLHGWRSQKEVWEPLVNELISQSVNWLINCYMLDLPGFGSSQVPSKPMTIGDYTDVVKDFIEKLNLKNVVIVGHSFGGRIGIKLASTHSELVSKLVLVDSAGFALNKGKKNLMAMAAKIAKPFFKPKIMQGLRKNIYKAIGAEDYVATPELQKTFVNVVGEDLTQDLKRISCPTLIVTGENDNDTPVTFGKKMQSLIPNSALHILKNAGHFSFLDNQEDFVVLLNTFIEK